MDLRNYKSWVFDCDGVLLDSNKIKSDGFYYAALPYGKQVADEFVSYHKKFGGISRYEKMKHFYCNMLSFDYDKEKVDKLVELYGEYCINKLKECDVIPKVPELLDSLQGRDCYVVSGTKEEELREVLNHKGMSKYFNGIYGSPDSKIKIMNKILTQHKMETPAVFVGDSKYDFDTGYSFGMDVIFMRPYSEFKGWESYFQNRKYLMVDSYTEILSQI